MYSIHTTPGFVIGSRPYGEAGKMLSIFTRDLGLVSVAAQGIRLEKSKLRYHTSDYSLGIFSLVRGKEVWRLTSAQQSVIPASQSAAEAQAGIQDLLTRHGDILDSHFHGNDKLKNSRKIHAQLLVRMSTLLKRLLQGEDPHPELFDCLESTVGISGHMPAEKLPELESLTALRILNLLGYIGDHEVTKPFVMSYDLSAELLSTFSPIRVQVNGIINASLQASQL
ncbi:MAG: recombination protein O N-terminal domain-containing protein [Patescibacteria group bacterium]